MYIIDDNSEYKLVLVKNRQTGSVLIICLIVVCLSLCFCLILLVLSRSKLKKEIKQYKERLSTKHLKKNPSLSTSVTPVTPNVIADIGGNGCGQVYNYNPRHELTAHARDIGETLQFVVKNNDIDD